MVSVLCVQPAGAGWLCKEIIKIFRLRRSAGPAFKATQAAGNNRNPPLKTFRTGLLPAGYGFSVQCKCFCRTCAVLVLKTGISMNVLFARAVRFFNASLKTHKKSSPVFYFVLYWFFINLTKKRVGGILKERGWRCVWLIHTHGKRLSQGFKRKRALTNRKCPILSVVSTLLAKSRPKFWVTGRLYFLTLSIF